MADIRPKDLATTATSPAADDYLLLDGPTEGTRRMLAVRPLVEDVRATGFTLALADAGKRFLCTATLTVTLPALATLGNGFACEVINDGAGDVTITGATSVVLDPDDVAVVMEANGKQRVVRGLSTVVRS